MSRNSWVFFTTCLLVLGPLPDCEALQADSNPVVLINIQNPRGLETNVAWTRELATETYERAGVILRRSGDLATNLHRRTLSRYSFVAFRLGMIVWDGDRLCALNRPARCEKACGLSLGRPKNPCDPS